MDLVTLALAKKYTNSKFKEIVSFGGFTIVDELPAEDISRSTIYLLRSSATSSGNVYTEYIYTSSGEWESLGTTVDLEGFTTVDEVTAIVQEQLGVIEHGTY